MALWWIVSVASGIALVLVGIADAFLSILHPDRDGPITRTSNRLVWSTAVRTGQLWPRAQREVLALAGPIMVLMDVLLWLLIPIVGYALIVWPFLPFHFDTPPGFRAGVFEAIYYSGVTFTTLGYGDITPVGRPWAALMVSEVVVGFLIMSISIAYIVSVFEGIDQRDSLALRVYSETAGTWRGREFVARSLGDEGVEVLRKRLETWASLLRDLHGRLYRFQGLAFYLRTRGLRHGPERMLYALAEVALDANILARAPGMRPLRPAAEHFAIAWEHFASAIVRRHGTRAAWDRMEEPVPTPEDARHVEEEWAAISGRFRLGTPETPVWTDPELLRLAVRKRIFLEQVDLVTCWRSLRREPGHRP